MPIARFEMPDGRIGRFEVPEGTTPEQAQSLIAEHVAQPIEPAKPSGNPDELLAKLGSPTKEQQIRSSFLNRLGKGALEPIIGAGQLFAHGLDAIAKPGSMAEGIGQSYDKYYGDEKAIQDEALKATNTGFDAAGLAGNLLSPANALIMGKLPVAGNALGKVLQGAATGAGAGAIMPKFSEKYGTDKLKQILKNAAIGGAMPVIGQGVKKSMSGLAGLIGGMGTHTGGEPIREAAQAGFDTMAKGISGDAFLNNLRDNVPKTDVLSSAKIALQEMGKQKSEAYQQGMAQISGDKSILGFDDIDKAIKDAYGKVSYEGTVTNKKAAAVISEMADEVTKWKRKDPNKFHTPMGLDALKRTISGIQERVPYEDKTSEMVAGNIYHSVKGSIAKQAPVYNDVMKDYGDAEDAIKEITKTLSLGKKSTNDAAMRKLQSVMRNNVNTSYGNRMDSVNALSENGAADIVPALAGQALSTGMPRGLGNLQAGGTATAAWLMGNPYAAIPALALQSPRLVGEAAYYGGKGAGLLSEMTRKAGQKTGYNGGLLTPYLINSLGK